jgi:murein peptide amidase A
VRQRRHLIVALIALLMGAAPVSAAPVVERQRIGRSVNDVRLRAVNIGARSKPTKVLVVGCIHGNECAGKAILRELRQMSAPGGFELWLIWSLNPDGQASGTRQNARGVDLNRNFPAGWRSIGEPWDTYHSGSRAASEPETRAAMRFVEEHRPDITIWYHHRWVQRRYAARVGLPWVRLDPLPGTATRWQNRNYPGHTSFVVELPAGSMSERSAKRHARAVRAAGREWAARR